jgi:hypothetical protein
MPKISFAGKTKAKKTPTIIFWVLLSIGPSLIQLCMTNSVMIILPKIALPDPLLPSLSSSFSPPLPPSLSFSQTGFHCSPG